MKFTAVLAVLAVSAATTNASEVGVLDVVNSLKGNITISDIAKLRSSPSDAGCWKRTYLREIGKRIHVCPEGQDLSMHLCFPKCEEGYRGKGPVCTKGVKLYPRMGHFAHCPEGEENDGGRCYKPCPGNVNGHGPVCWSECPEGYASCGGLCLKDKKCANKLVELAKSTFKVVKDAIFAGNPLSSTVIAVKGGVDVVSQLKYPLCPKPAGWNEEAEKKSDQKPLINEEPKEEDDDENKQA